jgi:hypothetical protein
VASGDERRGASNSSTRSPWCGNAVLADLARIVSRGSAGTRRVAPLRGRSWAGTGNYRCRQAKDERAAEISRKHTEGTRSAYLVPTHGG